MSDKFIDIVVKIMLVITLGGIALGVVVGLIWLAAFVLKLT